MIIKAILLSILGLILFLAGGVMLFVHPVLGVLSCLMSAYVAFTLMDLPVYRN